SGEPAVSGAYSNGLFWPALSVSGFTGIAQAAGYPEGLYDRIWSASGSATFNHSVLSHFAAATVSYEHRFFVPHTEGQFAPDARFPRLPARGSTGTLSLSWLFSSARGFANSI